MKIKLYTHNLKVSIDDDILKVKEFLTRKIKETANKDISFSFDIEDTNISLTDFDSKLAQQLDGKYDTVGYIFDRYDQKVSQSLAWSLSKNTQAFYVQTSIQDDAVGGTWVSIAHELTHTFFWKLKSHGISVFDPMDWMIVNGAKTPYYKNDTPTATDGNFALAYTLLAQYWNKIEAPVAPIVINTKPHAILTREPSTTNETLGTLVAVNGKNVFACKTLELPWLNNRPMVSCIPPGIYTVKKVFWLRKLKSFYQVQNVPGRSGIFMHEGNYYFNYEGCIGLGKTIADLNKDGEKDITDTLATVKQFESFMEGKEFTLEIR